MEKLLFDALSALGLSSKEIRFFEKAFSLGNASITQIAKAARLQRSTAYLIAKELLEKGLIEEDFKNYRKTITAASPKTVLRLLSAKQRSIKRQELVLSERLSELEAL